MEIRYFRTAWDDLRQSPGWFGKIVLLALLNLIPIFGQIVSLGYLYGWAREIAWNVHEPLPEHIFGNEDGKLYRRGFFVLVVQVVYLIIPGVLYFVGASLTGMLSDFGTDIQYGMDPYSSYYGVAPAATYRYFGWGMLAIIASIVVFVLMQLLLWVGSMRTSVYNRVSAGLQFGRVWKMMRKDVRGLLRIFGIQIVFGLILFAFSLIMSVIAVAVSLGSILVLGVGGAIGSAETALLAVMAPIVIALFAIMAFGTSVIDMIANAVVIRACGYWTSQFDVPNWRGQDEPMPFEEGAPTAAYYAPWSGYAASYEQQKAPWAQAQAPYAGQTQQPYAQQPYQAQAQQPYEQQPQRQPSYQAQVQQAPRQGEGPQTSQQPWTQQPQQPADGWQSGSLSSASGDAGAPHSSGSAAEAAESMANAAAAGTQVPEAHSVAPSQGADAGDTSHGEGTAGAAASGASGVERAGGASADGTESAAAADKASGAEISGEASDGASDGAAAQTGDGKEGPDAPVR
jgi:hypothetical protein